MKNKDYIGNSVTPAEKKRGEKIDEQSKTDEKLPVCKKAVPWQIICT